MENYHIKITLTDGERKVEKIAYYEHYLLKKEIRGQNLLDEIVEKLFNELKEKQNEPKVSDNFQIGPEGAYEDDLSDWDATLQDGLDDL